MTCGVTVENMGSRSECMRSGNAGTFSQMRDAHVNVVSSLVTAFCDPEFDGFVEQAVNRAADFPGAFARALAGSQSGPVRVHVVMFRPGLTRSPGACPRAERLHAPPPWPPQRHGRRRPRRRTRASAKAIDIEQCPCEPDLLSVSLNTAPPFRELTAAVFALAETAACVKGNQEYLARPYASCVAASYAALWGDVRAQPLLRPPLQILLRTLLRTLLFTPCMLGSTPLPIWLISVGVQSSTPMP